MPKLTFTELYEEPVGPLRLRNRDLRKNKFRDEKEDYMGRPHTNCKREELSMGKKGVTKGYSEFPDNDSEGNESSKQYFQTGPKYNGPNYVQKSVTGPLQNGGKGGLGAK